MKLSDVSKFNSTQAINAAYRMAGKRVPSQLASDVVDHQCGYITDDKRHDACRRRVLKELHQ